MNALKDKYINQVELETQFDKWLYVLCIITQTTLEIRETVAEAHSFEGTLAVDYRAGLDSGFLQLPEKFKALSTCVQKK